MHKGTEPTNQAIVLSRIFAEEETIVAEAVVDLDTVTFDAPQQEKVNKLIKEAQGRAAKELRSENTKLKKQIDDLPKLKEPETTVVDDDHSNDATKQVTEFKRIAEQRGRDAEASKKEADQARKDADKAKHRAIETEKRFALTTAASKQDFVDVSDVIALTSGSVIWSEDDSKFIVVNEHGEPRYNAAFQPMSVEEFYTDYASKKSHLVRSGARGGLGSTTSTRSSLATGKGYELDKIFGNKSDAGLANRLAKENPVEYKRLRVQAVEAGMLRR
jgi:hypothetical protein